MSAASWANLIVSLSSGFSFLFHREVRQSPSFSSLRRSAIEIRVVIYKLQCMFFYPTHWAGEQPIFSAILATNDLRSIISRKSIKFALAHFGQISTAEVFFLELVSVNVIRHWDHPSHRASEYSSRHTQLPWCLRLLLNVLAVFLYIQDRYQL